MSLNTNTKIVAMVIALACTLTGCARFNQTTSTPRDNQYLLINKVKVFVEVAKTPKEQERGLSYRNSLPSDQGMLFIYANPRQYSFWMHEMNFALDFLWIDENKVLDITENVPPPRETNNVPTIIQPRVPVRYVLEVNTGWIKKNQIKIGDQVEFFINTN